MSYQAAIIWMPAYQEELQLRMEHYFALLKQGELHHRAGHTLKVACLVFVGETLLGHLVSPETGYVVHFDEPLSNHIRFSVINKDTLFETYEEAWDWLETWRLMNGMNVDGTAA